MMAEALPDKGKAYGFGFGFERLQYVGTQGGPLGSLTYVGRRTETKVLRPF